MATPPGHPTETSPSPPPSPPADAEAPETAPSETDPPASDAAAASLAEEPRASARRAGLRHVSDDDPGIRRRRRGRGFSYHGPDGETLRGAERERCEELVIPPAWTEVWICPHPDGHLQATGRDDAGRKQYLYHPRWREARDAEKFRRLSAFGRTLPRIRRRLDQDLRRTALSREKVLGLVLYILDATGLRIGNREYAEDHGSYGLTTLRKKHIDLHGATLHLEFTGKSGVEQQVDLRDPRVVRAIRRCEDLPGYDLFQYLDGDGGRHRVGSEAVNEYLETIAGVDFTAKDFRTWRGTVLALERCLELHREVLETVDDEPESPAEALADLVPRVVREVAEELGNTPAVCREYYIHPQVLEAFTDGKLPSPGAAGDGDPPSPEAREELEEWLDEAELALLVFLETSEAG